MHLHRHQLDVERDAGRAGSRRSSAGRWCRSRACRVPRSRAVGVVPDEIVRGDDAVRRDRDDSWRRRRIRESSPARAPDTAARNPSPGTPGAWPDRRVIWCASRYRCTATGDRRAGLPAGCPQAFAVHQRQVPLQRQIEADRSAPNSDVDPVRRLRDTSRRLRSRRDSIACDRLVASSPDESDADDVEVGGRRGGRVAISPAVARPHRAPARRSGLGRVVAEEPHDEARPSAVASAR